MLLSYLSHTLNRISGANAPQPPMLEPRAKQTVSRRRLSLMWSHRARAQAAMLEQCHAGRSDSNDDVAVHVPLRDQPAIVRLLPDRELWTRRAPRVHHFVVAPLAVCHPLEEIEHQRFDCIEHRFLYTVNANSDAKPGTRPDSKRTARRRYVCQSLPMRPADRSPLSTRPASESRGCVSGRRQLHRDKRRGPSANDPPRTHSAPAASRT